MPCMVEVKDRHPRGFNISHQDSRYGRAPCVGDSHQARPACGESVAARPHLVLLKSRLRQRRAHRGPSVGSCRREAGPVDSSSPRDPRLRSGRFERVAAVEERPEQQCATPSSGGLGRPREAPRAPFARGRDSSPRGSTPLKQTPTSPRRSPEHAKSSGFPGDQALSSFGSAAMVPEDDDGGGHLVECADCGRKFNEDRLAKHAKICKKVFSQKRKPFNSAANRLGELENAQDLIANAKKIGKDKENAQKKKPTTSKAAGADVPEWKKKSLAFRAAILAARGDTGDENAAAQAGELQSQLDAAGGADSHLLKCPHCGRTFNKEAGERHVAICVKTFGSKPGGGRLTRGAGRPAVGGPSGGKKPGAEAPPLRGNSASRARAEPAAATRRPSAHRSRGSALQVPRSL